MTTIAMLAKIAMAGCFAVIYNFTAELFPTVVRNSAVGLCSMAARLGGMLTPQITLLVGKNFSVTRLWNSSIWNPQAHKFYPPSHMYLLLLVSIFSFRLKQDSLDKRVPTLVFGGVAIFAAILALFLPETLHKDLPQTLEDGENFGKGDTAFASCCGKSRRHYMDDSGNN